MAIQYAVQTPDMPTSWCHHALVFQTNCAATLKALPSDSQQIISVQQTSPQKEAEI
jgi:hypothetical protein